jgi:hypothetical protein
MFTCMVHLDDPPWINGWRLYAVHWNSESQQWARSIQELVPIDPDVDEAEHVAHEDGP